MKNIFLKSILTKNVFTSFEGNQILNNWELGNPARQLEPRREQVSGYPAVTRASADDSSSGHSNKCCHLTLELGNSPPRKRDIATNVPDVKTSPTASTVATTFIKASNDKNGSAATNTGSAMVTSVWLKKFRRCSLFPLPLKKYF